MLFPNQKNKQYFTVYKVLSISTYFILLITLQSKLYLNNVHGGSDSKESACNAGDPVQSLGREDPLEKEMATHSSILSWRIPWTEELGGLQSMVGGGHKELDESDMTDCASTRIHTHTHTHYL